MIILQKNKSYLVKDEHEGSIWEKVVYLGRNENSIELGGSFSFPDGEVKEFRADLERDLFWVDDWTYFSLSEVSNKTYEEREVAPKLISSDQEKAILEILNLKDGWSSFSNSKAPKKGIVFAAKDLASYLGEKAIIVPNSDGSITITANNISYTISKNNC